ncbi:MAG: ABC transporter substrate-binding protein [Deltaproteobacteria bacterium RBG_16_48_10]|nr:MAG: ABC transporter substrate-binding protein [Deltaproteobacteria bacterium RBG_16_48_10]
MASSKGLLIFAGAASKPATEEVVKSYSAEGAIPVDVVFGGSGYILSQMRLSRRGDLYFPGSSDFMELAKRGGWVFSDSEKIVAYLIPAINVQRGNPKHLSSLRDLTRDGIRVAIGHPEKVCVGTYAVEIVEKNLTSSEKERFRKNIVSYVESCEKTANVIVLKAVDAVLGWSVFQDWNPDRIETVYLKPEEIPRIGYLPIAISKFSTDRSLAQRFIDFLASPQGKTIFRKHGYLIDPQEARRLTLPTGPIGGEYSLPAEWQLYPPGEKKR